MYKFFQNISFGQLALCTVPSSLRYPFDSLCNSVHFLSTTSSLTLDSFCYPLIVSFLLSFKVALSELLPWLSKLLMIWCLSLIWICIHSDKVSWLYRHATPVTVFHFYFVLFIYFLQCLDIFLVFLGHFLETTFALRPISSYVFSQYPPKTHLFSS